MKILVAGGSGMIGKHLASELESRGAEVFILSRSKEKFSTHPNIPHIVSWKPESQVILSNFPSPDVIINLAGHNLDCRWTTSNRKKILDSRIQSTSLLVSQITSRKWNTSLYIGASATGYYSSVFGVKTEEDASGDGFLSEVVKKWEAESESLEKTTCRRVLLRFPAVLAAEGGVVGKLKPLVKWLGGFVPGSGKQRMSFVHVDDLCRIISHVIDHPEMKGIFNANSPLITDQRTFTETFAKEMGKKVLMKSSPTFPLKMLLGERSGLVLDDQAYDSSKLRKTGFRFKFPDIQSAMQNVLTNEDK
ncbi:MAG: TIGR01777 family oxidoreductase [Flavobacteriales bacterium]|nr:TIGR01777 family oxidoreductase [Flavobacteriales bacterium]